MKRLFVFLLSGWSFFFRWPVIHIQSFQTSGVMLGGLYQTLIVFITGTFAKFLGVSPEFSAFIGLAALAILSGFFHEDGFADTADSLGVSKFDSTPETLARLNNAMKDSRLGSFGVCALILFWFCRYHIAMHISQPILFCSLAVLFSRTSALSMGVLESRRWKYNPEAKASYVVYTIPNAAAFAALLGALVIALLLITSLSHLPILAILLQSAILWSGSILFSAILLRLLANRMECLSGDLIGGTASSAELFIYALFLFLL